MLHGGSGFAGEILDRLRWIVVEDALAAFAGHDLLAPLQVLKELEAQRDLTGAAAAIHRFSNTDSFAAFANSLIKLERAGGDLGGADGGKSQGATG